MSTPTKSAASWPTWFRLPTSVLARGGSGTRGAGGESARPGGSTPSGRPAPAGGRPPEPHPVWSRLDSPLSTYYLLIGSAGMLLVIGLVMVLSASSVGAMSKQGDPYAVFANQARYAVVGLGFAWIAARIPVELWKRAAVPLLLGATTLQLLVFTPLGFEVNGNRNWLRLGIQLQPSELGKLGIILFAATVFSAKRRLLHDWKHAVIPVVAPCGILLVGLVMAGRDLGTALILLLILSNAVQNSMNVMNAMQILPGGVGKFLVYNRTGAGGLRHSRALQKAGAAIDELPGWPVTISDNDVMLRAQMKCQAVWDVSFGRGSELDTDLRKFASLVFQRLGLRGQRA